MRSDAVGEPGGTGTSAGGDPSPSRPVALASAVPTCNNCGFEVISRAWGCKNPCPNCGTIYPLGDCSD